MEMTTSPSIKPVVWIGSTKADPDFYIVDGKIEKTSLPFQKM